MLAKNVSSGCEEHLLSPLRADCVKDGSGPCRLAGSGAHPAAVLAGPGRLSVDFLADVAKTKQRMTKCTYIYGFMFTRNAQSTEWPSLSPPFSDGRTTNLAITSARSSTSCGPPRNSTVACRNGRLRWKSSRDLPKKLLRMLVNSIHEMRGRRFKKFRRSRITPY